MGRTPWKEVYPFVRQEVDRVVALMAQEASKMCRSTIRHPTKCPCILGLPHLQTDLASWSNLFVIFREVFVTRSFHH